MSWRVSVSNLELFRIWNEAEDLDLNWLLSRLRGEEQTEAMKVGQAFHQALETACEGEVDSLMVGPYRFDFNCCATIELEGLRELPIEKQYGELLVRGRVDLVRGRTVTDYKTTEQFDADRLWSGYQWRFYLDMLECDCFYWKAFVLKEFGDPGNYSVRDMHTICQYRYPSLHADCCQLAADYLDFARIHLTPVLEASLQEANR